MTRSILVAQLASFLAVAFGQPALSADLERVDRGIGKEPAYKQKAWYALLVFGPEAQSRVWLVLDGHFSEFPLPGGTVFVDRNANGDLAESADRLEFRSLGDGELTVRTAAYGSVVERGMTHEIRELRQVNAGRQNEPPIFLILLRIDGRYTQRAEIEFADSPAKASIYPFDGPLSMMAYSGSQEFRPGEKTGLVVASIGTPGHAAGQVVAQVVAQPLVTIFSGEFPKDLHPVAEIVFPAADPSTSAAVAAHAVLDDRC